MIFPGFELGELGGLSVCLSVLAPYPSFLSKCNSRWRRDGWKMSVDGDEEVFILTDFSKKPEAMAKGKRKTKRYKTTEDKEIKIILDPKFETPEKKPPKISAAGGGEKRRYKKDLI